LFSTVVTTPRQDHIRLADIAVHAHHGALAAENELGQRFLLTITIEVNSRAAAVSDQVRDTIDYAEIYRLVTLAQGPSGAPHSRRQPTWRDEVTKLPPSATASFATAGAIGSEIHALEIEPVRSPDDTVGEATTPKKHIMLRGPFQLIETLGHEIALGILARYPQALSAEVVVRKPSVPIAGVVAYAEVAVRRVRADLNGPKRTMGFNA